MIFFSADIEIFKVKALNWASSFNVCCYLDSNKFADKYSKFETLIAVGARDELKADTGTAFEKLENFRKKHNEWILGNLTYDLKNEIESLQSDNLDQLNFPDLYFFVPEILIKITGNNIEIIGGRPKQIFTEIEQLNADIFFENKKDKVNVQSKLSEAEYINIVDKIKEHITKGDIYVSNFCQEFYALNSSINPACVYYQLNKLSPSPFSCFFRQGSNFIMSASPERFLAKRGSKLISQPIKGTARRGKNEEEDQQIKIALRNNQKELQENVMIVDLVRNDLTKSAKYGSVKTEELFGIYTFNQVHQMISTVTCEILHEISDIQAIKNSFPMGSMTGAPKIKAMELMELYEQSRRGLYSGAIGYFAPDGDFDFNVVIRSILYNSSNKYLSFQAGSAITYQAKATDEYQECLLKAKAIIEVLT